VIMGRWSLQFITAGSC